MLRDAKFGAHLSVGTRTWKNQPDGKLVASSDVQGQQKLGKVATAPGTWHVGDNGTYCVTLEWEKRTENWCRYMFKLNDKYYGVKSLADGAAKAQEFEFSK